MGSRDAIARFCDPATVQHTWSLVIEPWVNLWVGCDISVQGRRHKGIDE
ncbi:MAG: hypothetical protein NZM37_04870 [Sandaracinaceae bacterium]|nr:hypothetical protein [Sandaracinaceae bacterium]